MGAPADGCSHQISAPTYGWSQVMVILQLGATNYGYYCNVWHQYGYTELWNAPNYGCSQLCVFPPKGSPTYGCSHLWVLPPMGAPTYGCSHLWVLSSNDALSIRWSRLWVLLQCVVLVWVLWVMEGSPLMELTPFCAPYYGCSHPWGPPLWCAQLRLLPTMGETTMGTPN